MSLDLQPGEGSLEEGHLADVDTNTTLLLELVGLMHRNNYLLAAINLTLGAMSNNYVRPESVADLEDGETN